MLHCIHGTLYSDKPTLLSYFYIVTMCYIIIMCYIVIMCYIFIMCYTVTMCYIVIMCYTVLLCYNVLHCVTLWYIEHFTLLYIVICSMAVCDTLLHFVLHYTRTVQLCCCATFMPRQREFYMEFIFGRNLRRHQRENRQCCLSNGQKTIGVEHFLHNYNDEEKGCVGGFSIFSSTSPLTWAWWRWWWWWWWSIWW